MGELAHTIRSYVYGPGTLPHTSHLHQTIPNCGIVQGRFEEDVANTFNIFENPPFKDTYFILFYNACICICVIVHFNKFTFALDYIIL